MPHCWWSIWTPVLMNQKEIFTARQAYDQLPLKYNKKQENCQFTSKYPGHSVLTCTMGRVSPSKRPTPILLSIWRCWLFLFKDSKDMLALITYFFLHFCTLNVWYYEIHEIRVSWFIANTHVNQRFWWNVLSNRMGFFHISCFCFNISWLLIFFDK